MRIVSLHPGGCDKQSPTITLELCRGFIMGNSQQVMPKVDFESNENLKVAHSYSKYLEAKNFERVIIAKKKLRKKRIYGTLGFATVIGIYAFTIFKVKQETFLDDFEEPPRIIKNDN